MFDNNLKILLRTAHKRLFVFGLNMLGLSIGISCVVFITIYSIDELSFDKHFQNHDRIYRVVTEYQTNSSSDLSMAESFLGVAPTLKREFAEVEDATLTLLLVADQKNFNFPILRRVFLVIFELKILSTFLFKFKRGVRSETLTLGIYISTFNF